MKKQYIILSFLFLTGILYAQDFEISTINKENKVGKSGEIEAFKMYPNPVTNGKLFIHTSLNSNKTIQIFDILGKLVISVNLSGKELNVAKLPSGVYILKVFEDGKRASRKLVIK